MSIKNTPGADFPWFQGKGNDVTQYTRAQAASFARHLLTSEAYRDSIESRLLRGDLPPAVEAMLWHYAFGKPVEEVNVNVKQHEEDLSSLSLPQLLEKAEELKRTLEEAAATEAAIPAEFKRVA